MPMSAFLEEVSIYFRVWGTSAHAKLKEVLRDVRERGRDIDGCIKQWMTFVKPNFSRHVEPQRNLAGMITLKYTD